MGSSLVIEKPHQAEYKFTPFKIQQIKPRGSAHPHARSGHRIVCDSSNFYSYGGYNPYLSDNEKKESDLVSGVLYKELWSFNFASEKWIKLTPNSQSFQTQLASNAVVLAGSTLIVHGGTGTPFGYSCTNDTLFYSLKNGVEFVRMDCKGSIPRGQYGHALVIFNNYLYSVGGTTGMEYFLDVHRLNLNTLTWEEVYVCNHTANREPEPRYRHEIALHDNKILVFGGGTNADVYGFQEVPAFNLEKNCWDFITTIPDRICGYPQPRRCHGLVQIPEEGDQHSQVVICGGTNGRAIFYDNWRLDLTTRRWHRLTTNLITPIFFHSACLAESGKVFIFGGLTKVEDETRHLESIRNNEVHSLWVRIPKLKEMCWDAMLYYARLNICKASVNQLLNCGIPVEFIDRIVTF